MSGRGFQKKDLAKWPVYDLTLGRDTQPSWLWIILSGLWQSLVSAIVSRITSKWSTTSGNKTNESILQEMLIEKIEQILKKIYIKHWWIEITQDKNFDDVDDIINYYIKKFEDESHSKNVEENKKATKRKIWIFNFLKNKIYESFKWKIELLTTYWQIPKTKITLVIIHCIYTFIQEQYSYISESLIAMHNNNPEWEKHWNEKISLLSEKINKSLLHLVKDWLPWDYWRFNREKPFSEFEKWLENCIRWAYIFVSPWAAKSILWEISSASQVGNKFNSVDYLDKIDNWWHLNKIISFLNKNIDFIFGKDTYSKKLWTLLYYFQKIKIELFSWASIIESLWEIIRIFYQDALHNEIDKILKLFEPIREDDIRVIRTILNDYKEIIEPKRIRESSVNWDLETEQITISTLIEKWLANKHWIVYQSFIKKAQQISFIWEISSRLRRAPNISVTESDCSVILEKLKRILPKNWKEIINWEIKKYCFSPDKQYLAVLIEEGDWNNNVHIVSVTDFTIIKSYIWLPIKGSHKDINLRFLENLNSGAEYILYLSDEKNYILLWDNVKNKKTVGPYDIPIGWWEISLRRIKWTNIELKRSVSVSKIDNWWRYLFRIYSLTSKYTPDLLPWQKPLQQFWLRTVEPSKQTDVSIYLSIYWLTDSYVEYKWKDVNHIFPTRSLENILLPFIPTDNSLFISNNWKYLAIVREPWLWSDITWSFIYIHEINKRVAWSENNLSTDIYEIDCSKIWNIKSVQNIIFSNSEDIMYILHDEWNITIYDIKNKKVVKIFKAEDIIKRLSWWSKTKIHRFSIDSNWRYIAVSWLDNGKYYIGIIDILSWKIKKLPIEEKNDEEPMSPEVQYIEPLHKPFELLYSQNWKEFKLKFIDGRQEKFIDLSGIISAIENNELPEDITKDVLISSEQKYLGNQLNIYFNYKTGYLQISTIQTRPWLKDNTKDICRPSIKKFITETVKAKQATANHKSKINFCNFTQDWQELLFWTNDWIVWIIWRKIIDWLFKED